MKQKVLLSILIVVLGIILSIGIINDKQTIFVDVYPVPTYNEAKIVQKEFTKFDAEIIYWNVRTLKLRVKAKSIDTLISYLPDYQITSRNGNNNISLEKK